MASRSAALFVALVVVCSGLVTAKPFATVYDALNQTSTLSVLKAAANAASLNGLLSSPDLKATIIAPLDQAFQSLTVGTPVNLTALVLDTEGLTSALQYHVLVGKALDTSMLTSGTYTMANNQNVTVLRDNKGNIFIRDALGRKAKVVMSNVVAGKAYVHIVNKVLVPSF